MEPVTGGSNDEKSKDRNRVHRHVGDLVVGRRGGGRAQGDTGTIAGAVKDETGLSLPGVTVQVSSPALIEGTRVTTTDGDGRYQMISLRPGAYRVTFELPGSARCSVRASTCRPRSWPPSTPR
jgi:protocatechuate 3,4-dioxygenase beta subunit